MTKAGGRRDEGEIAAFGPTASALPARVVVGLSVSVRRVVDYAWRSWVEECCIRHRRQGCLTRRES